MPPATTTIDVSARERAIRAGLGALAAASLALAAFMTADPAGFVDEIGPFGQPNGHYVRDLATWAAAYGLILIVAIGRRSWRVPILAVGVVQGSLHVLNHIADAGAADPVWKGSANVVLLLIATAATAWLMVAAYNEEER